MRYIKMKDVIATSIIRIILAAVLTMSFSGLANAQEEPVFVQKDFQPTFQNAIPLNISNTGAATYNIPIIVPPGRGGIAMPNLALTYNSQQKNGWVGMGWDLEVGSIQRSTKWGVDYSGTDFVVDGSLELVPRTDWGYGYYGAKIEGGFTKYRLNYSIAGWVATARDGTKYYYGTTTSSTQDNGVDVFKWCLNRVVDTNGNTMTITYYKDTTNGEIYPDEINYPGNNKLKFIRESTPRLDNFPQYNTLWKVVTAYRLKTIEVYGNGQLARKYVLDYQYGTSSKRSRLIKVQVYGSNGSTALPPMTFTWQEGGDGHFGASQLSPVRSMSGGYFRFADISGDGRDDFVLISYREVYAYLSEGNTFGSEKHTTLSNGGSNVYLFDVDDDGRADLVSVSGGRVYTNHSNGNGTFVVDSIPSSLSGGQQVYIGDVNGDGLADIIGQTSNSNTIWTHLSHGDGTFESGIARTLVGLSFEGVISLGDVNGDGFADIVLSPTNNDINIFTYLSNGDGTFSDGIQQTFNNVIYSAQLADVNGDGLADFTRRYYSTLYTCLSKGDGTYNTCITKNLEPTNVSFADINGDGCVDLIGHLTTANVNVYLGNCDGTFKDPIPTNLGSNGPPFFFADVNGDGLSDIVDLQTYPTWYTYANLATGAFPDLLTVAKNGLGAEIDISYEPSSSYPPSAQPPRPSLPFIVNTVSSTSVKDGNGVVSDTTYTYADGYYDHATRDFWGFNKTVQTNPDLTTVTTYYHNGFDGDQYQPLDEFRKGRPYQVDLKTQTPSATLLTRQALTWQTYPTIPATWAFVKLTRSRLDYYNSPTVYAQEDNTYNDSYGYWLTKTASGTSAENVTTEHAYANMGTWLWRLSRETITGSTSVKVRETTYGYDGRGNMTSKALWLNTGGNPTISMTYDDYGNLKTLTDPRGNTTTTNYDTATYTYPVKVTAPQTSDGRTHIVEYLYNYSFGTVRWKRDERHYETSSTYDPFGRLSQVDYPDGGQQIITYNDAIPPNRYTLTKVKEASGQTVDTYQYFDGLDRKIAVVTFGEPGKQIDSTIHYDPMGRVDLTEGPYFNPRPSAYPKVETIYDYRGRPTQVTTPDGTYGTVTTGYSYSGLATTITDPDTRQKTETRDYLGRIIQVTEYANTGAQNTTYTYNAAGDLLTIKDPLNNTITNTYDTLGRKIAMIDPDLGSWEYIYDPNGNLLSETNDREGVMVASESTEVDNTYDAMNRVISETKIIQDEEYTTGYKYDVAGKPTLTTYPDGYKAEYKYWEGSGLLHTVTGITDSEVYASCSGYQPTGKMGQIVHGNNTTTTYIYDSQSTRLKEIVTVGPSGGIQDRTYTYTRAGDIWTIHDDLKPVTYTYLYDNLHRLLSEKIGANTSISYSYDKIGNITQKKVGTNTYVYTYDPVKKHAVKAITLNGGTPNQYTYDGVGNMTEGPDFTNPAIATRKIGYYADNLPASIDHSSNGSTYFYYDGLGNRVMKYAPGGGITHYIGDHFEVKDGVPTKYIFAGNLRVAKVTPPSTHYYYHKDHLSSSSAITDDNGAVIEMTEYRPFGDERDHAGTVVSDYKFTDQELDTETGLYNYDARHYDAVIGRFISADPTISAVYDPQSLNRYSYCLNNPLIYVDPDGQTPKSALTLISEHRTKIIQVANKYNVSPQAVASVVFQEKYHGIFADIKDIPANVDASLDVTKESDKRSIGLAEMQIKRAAELLGRDLSVKEQREEVLQTLKDKNKAIELIGMDIADTEKKLGKVLSPTEAAAGYNMGSKGLKDYLEGKRDLSDVAKRSIEYQRAIEKVISTGIVDPRKDIDIEKERKNKK